MTDKETIEALNLRILKMLADFNEINSIIDDMELSDGEVLDKICDITKKYRD